VVALGCRDVVARAFYSVGDGRTPVVVAVAAMALNAAGDLTIGRRWGIPGLAASTTVSFAVAAVVSAALLGRRHGALIVGPALAGLARVAGARVTAGALALTVREVAGLDEGSPGVVGRRRPTPPCSPPASLSPTSACFGCSGCRRRPAASGLARRPRRRRRP